MNTMPIVVSTNIKDIDLRPYDTPILDQLTVNDCGVNAAVGQVMFGAKLGQASVPLLSREQLYYDTRVLQNTVDQDSGTTADMPLKSLVKSGIAYDSSWEYGTTLLYTKPTADVVMEAAQHKVSNYTQITSQTQYNIIENSVKVMLSQGKLPSLAFTAYDWLMYATGTIDQQTGTGVHTGTSFGHAVDIVAVMTNGTSATSDDYYILRNSWGPYYGDRGYYKLMCSELTQDPAGVSLYVADGFNGQDWTWTQQRNDVAELYVALYNRAPDHSGQDYWAAAMVTNGASQAQVADSILLSAEAQAIFPNNSSNAQYIDKLYINALDRAAGTDVEGRTFWTNALNNGADRGTILVNILDATQAYVKGSNSQYDADAIHSKNYFNDRVDVAMHTGVTYQSDNLNVARVALVGVTDNYDSVNAANLSIAHQLGIV